ncbi:MAG: DUF6152 family protein [Candidatus Rokubacteria bacterium]|nr:DUF6152 family protein [Candidatus Rokubacteria bacterium]
MQTRSLMLALAAALTLAGTGAAGAHHGWSGYDSNNTLTLTGMIRESGYEHPHGYVKLETPGKTWVVVLAPPSRMERRGLPASMLKPGTTATVVGYPNRTEPEEMRAERITVENKTVELR